MVRIHRTRGKERLGHAPAGPLRRFSTPWVCVALGATARGSVALLHGFPRLYVLFWGTRTSFLVHVFVNFMAVENCNMGRKILQGCTASVPEVLAVGGEPGHQEQTVCGTWAGVFRRSICQ